MGTGSSKQSKYVAESKEESDDIVQDISIVSDEVAPNNAFPPKAAESPLKRAMDMPMNRKVWGHSLLPSSNESMNPVDRPPYHDDYEEVLETYSEDIFPIEQYADDLTTFKSDSMQNLMISSDNPNDPSDTLSNKCPPRPEPPRKAIKLAFPDPETLHTDKALKSIEDIRQQQHNRIVEQMRLFESKAKEKLSVPAASLPVVITSSDGTPVLQGGARDVAIMKICDEGLAREGLAKNEEMMTTKELRQGVVKMTASGGMQRNPRPGYAVKLQVTQSSGEVTQEYKVILPASPGPEMEATQVNNSNTWTPGAHGSKRSKKIANNTNNDVTITIVGLEIL